MGIIDFVSSGSCMSNVYSILLFTLSISYFAGWTKLLIVSFLLFFFFYCCFLDKFYLPLSLLVFWTFIVYSIALLSTELC